MSSVLIKYGANGKTAKANVCGTIFANFSANLGPSPSFELERLASGEQRGHAGEGGAAGARSRGTPSPADATLFEG